MLCYCCLRTSCYRKFGESCKQMWCFGFAHARNLKLAAILATESKIIMYGETTIANNTATVGSGGGISLLRSDLEVRRDCIISGKDAVRGGGIHATSSTFAVY